MESALRVASVGSTMNVPSMRMRRTSEVDDQVPLSSKRPRCESAMLHPTVPSESSLSLSLERTPKLRLVASMTTWYVVFAERLRLLAGANVLSPSVFESGSVSVARLVPGEPDASVKMLTFGL